jgi:hypothetical protein
MVGRGIVIAGCDVCGNGSVTLGNGIGGGVGGNGAVLTGTAAGSASVTNTPFSLHAPQPDAAVALTLQ